MCYGGFLFCFGWPTDQSFTGAYNDAYAMGSEKVKAVGGELQSIGRELGVSSLNDLRNQLKELLKKFSVHNEIYTICKV